MKRVVHLTSDWSLDSADFCINISSSSVYVYICMWEGKREIAAVNMPTSLSLLSCHPLPACALYPTVQNREGLGKPLFPSLSSFIFQPFILELEMSNRPSLNHCVTRCQHFSPIESRVRHKHRVGYGLTSTLHILDSVCFWHKQSQNRFLDLWSLCCAVTVRVWDQKPRTHESDDSPETRTPDSDPEVRIISTCHTHA